VQRLESLLIGLREWLKATHLSVHVFNWEMDLEHRYSAAMTESHKSLQERAILLANAELQAAKPRGITVEELYIAKRYKLERVMTCAIEQDEFLTALLAHPETYFPPQVVAMCGPPKVVVDMEEDSEEVEEDIPIAEFATSLGKFRGRCSAAVRFRYILTDLDKS